MAGTALADVDLTSSVSTGLTLTDNRDFEHDAESDLILSLTPRIGLRQVGGRSDTALDYSVSAQYAHRDTEVDLIHTLNGTNRSEEHTSELQSLMRISYAVFCLKKKKQIRTKSPTHTHKTQSHTTTMRR